MRLEVKPDFTVDLSGNSGYKPRTPSFIFSQP
jgi:hypothetical protein